MIVFEHTSVPLVDADFDEVERRFAFIFPEDFRKHYLKHNGGHPDKNRFVDVDRTCVVHDFFPLKQSAIPTLLTFEKCYERLRTDQQSLPLHLIPFASDPFGNLYCFSVRLQDFGAIFWLKMDGNRRADGDRLSQSLNSFLQHLTIEAAQRLR